MESRPGAAAPATPAEVDYASLWRTASAILPTWTLPDGVAASADVTAVAFGQDKAYAALWAALLEDLRLGAGWPRVNKLLSLDDEQPSDEPLPVDDHSLLLLFLHFCSFSWHSGGVVCSRMRFSCWRLVMSQSMAETDPTVFAAAFEFALPTRSKPPAVPSLSLSGFAHALRCLALHAALRREHAAHSQSEATGNGGSLPTRRQVFERLVAEVDEGVSQQLARLEARAQLGRLAPAAPPPREAREEARTRQVLQQRGKEEMEEETDELQCVRDAAAAIERAPQLWSLLFTGYSRPLPEASVAAVRVQAPARAPAPAPVQGAGGDDSTTATVVGKATAEVAAEAAAAEAAAEATLQACVGLGGMGEPLRGVRPSELRELAGELRCLCGVACTVPRLSTVHARLDDAPLSLLQLASLLRLATAAAAGGAAGGVAGGAPASPLDAALECRTHASLCSRLLALGRPLPLLPAPLPPLPAPGTRPRPQLPSVARHHMSDDAIEAALRPLCAADDGGDGGAYDALAAAERAAAAAADASTDERAARGALPCLLSEPLAPPPCSVEVLQLVRQAVLQSSDAMTAPAATVPAEAAAAPGIEVRSVALLRRAREAYAVELPADAPFSAHAATFFLLSMGNACLTAGQPRDALRRFAQARRAAAPLGGDDAAHGCVACCLGAACYALGRYALAAALFARALVARSDAHAGDAACHVLDLVLPLHNFAASLDCGGARSDAFVLYSRAEKLMRAQVSPGHPRMEIVLGNMSRQQSIVFSS